MYALTYRERGESKTFPPYSLPLSLLFGPGAAVCAWYVHSLSLSNDTVNITDTQHKQKEAYILTRYRRSLKINHSGGRVSLVSVKNPCSTTLEHT